MAAPLAQSVTVTIGAVLSGNFVGGFSAADREVNKLKGSVGGLDRSLITLNKRLWGIEKAAGAALTSLQALHKANGSSAFNYQSALTNNAKIIESNQLLASSYRRLAAQRRALNRSLGLQPVVTPPRRPPGGGGSALVPVPTGGHGSSRLHNFATSAKSVGLTVGGTGAVALWGMSHMIKPAEEYQHQLAQMNVAGMTHLETVKATAAAWKAASVIPTTSVMENMSSIRELRMVFGDTQHAIEHMPVVQKMQSVLEVLMGHGAGEQAYTAAKALELKGAIRTPEEFLHQADMMTKSIVASGGKLNASDFSGTFKFARAATSGWNDEFAYQILPTLMQEMKAQGGMGGGAGGPGSALMSAYRAVVGGHIPKSDLAAWEQLGLLDPSKEIRNKKGKLTGLEAGGVRQTELFQANPYAWVQTVMLPALKKQGITSEAQIKQAMAGLFENRTSQFIMTNLATRKFQFERDQRLIKQAQGIDAYNTLLKSDPRMARLALQKQWESLMATLGYQVMPDLISGAFKLIGVFKSMSAWMKEHPDLTRTLTKIAAGTAAFMTLGGAVTYVVGKVSGLVYHLGRLALTIVGFNFAKNAATGAAAAAGAASSTGAAAAGGAGAGMLARSALWAARGPAAILGGSLWAVTKGVDLIDDAIYSYHTDKSSEYIAGLQSKIHSLEREEAGQEGATFRGARGNVNPNARSKLNAIRDELEATKQELARAEVRRLPQAPPIWTPSEKNIFSNNLNGLNALTPQGGNRPALDIFRRGMGANEAATTAGGGQFAGWQTVAEMAKESHDDKKDQDNWNQIMRQYDRAKTTIVTKQGTFHLDVQFNGIVDPTTIAKMTDAVRQGIKSAAPDWTESAHNESDLYTDGGGLDSE